MSQIIVFDIGNTNICIGAFNNSKLLWQARIVTDSSRSSEDYQTLVEQLLSQNNSTISSDCRVVLASVVPVLSARFEQIISNKFGVKALIVGPAACAGISINISNPVSVGADRIANTVAAGSFHSKPALVVDFGTATTFDVVGSDGAYEGGIIAPGPETALSALVQRTAQLSKIELVWPKQVLGKSTEAAMQSGLVIGYMELIDGLIERLREERGELGKIIATGGLGGLFVKHSRHMSLYEPNLTLIGLNKIGEFADGF